jgi:hypothetical protein
MTGLLRTPFPERLAMNYDPKHWTTLQRLLKCKRPLVSGSG